MSQPSSFAFLAPPGAETMRSSRSSYREAPTPLSFLAPKPANEAPMRRSQLASASAAAAPKLSCMESQLLFSSWIEAAQAEPPSPPPPPPLSVPVPSTTPATPTAPPTPPAASPRAQDELREACESMRARLIQAHRQTNEQTQKEIMKSRKT